MSGSTLSPGIRLRLSTMMFLQYFMFGAWFMTLGTYMSKGLHFDQIIGTAYGTQGIAAIISTLIIGVLADRYVAAQKLLGVLVIASGLTLFVASRIQDSPDLFVTVLLLHFLCFVPTIPLTNSIALNCLTDRAAQFPGIRVCGTAGWIIAGLLVGAIPGAAQTNLPMFIAGGAGMVLGIYSFSLPHTPPAGAGGDTSWRALFGLDMLKRLKERDFGTFMGGVLVVLVPLAFYNSYSNAFLSDVDFHTELFGHRIEATAIQTLGQFSELFLLLLLPLFLKRFGIKGVLVIGMFAWCLRYGLFAFGFDANGGYFAMLVAGVLLHGICYDFFFVAGQIYVDQRFEPALRARAQSFLVTINMGVGVVLGSTIANAIYRSATHAGGHPDWQMFWLVPAAVALVATVLFAGLFRAR